MAITTPYTDAAERGAFIDRQAAELTRMGMMSDGGAVNSAVADWIRRCASRTAGWICATWDPAQPPVPTSCCAGSSRGAAAKPEKTVVALRNAQLVTFTAMDIDDARALVPVLGVGLAQRPPARFDEFSLPARVGARADERLRNGALARRSP